MARLRSYGFCLETVRALAEVLGQPVRTGIYRAPTEAPVARTKPAERGPGWCIMEPPHPPAEGAVRS